MTARQRLPAALLLLTLALAPELLWAAAHLLRHHSHGGEVDHAGHHTAGLAALAEILVHGHHHPEGVPDHEHHLLPSSPARPEAQRGFAASERGALQAPRAEPLLIAATTTGRRLRHLAGPSPPLLDSLCTLRI